jgi:hypothetical protein
VEQKTSIPIFVLSVLLLLLCFSNPVYPSVSTYFDTVQKTYIGYYQRPGDPSGLIYWAARLDGSGGNLSEIIEAFANSAESQALYGTINSSNISTVVNGIYRALFGRDAEAAGLNYYVNGFNSGQFTAATIMLNVLYGAQNKDLQSVNNKVTAANLFTRTIDPELDGANLLATYAGNTDAQKARNFLSTVGWDPATIPTQDGVTLFIKNYIADPGDPISPAIPKTIITGTVSPPANVDPSSFTIVSPSQTSSVNSQGAYATEVYSDGVAVVAAMPQDKQFGLMNVVALLPASISTSQLTKGERKIVAAYQSSLSSSIELNAKTTAVSMVFITPYFLTNDPAKAATIIGIIQNDPKVENLGFVIESVFGEIDPLSNPVLRQGLIEAVQSVLNTVSTQASKSIQTLQPSPAKLLQLPRTGLNSELLNATTYYADRDYVTVVAEPSSSGYNVSIESKDGGSVDWIADVIQLDSSQFSSLANLEAKASDYRTIYNKEGDQVLDELNGPAKSFLRYIDIIDVAFDWASDQIFGNSVKDHMTVPSDQDNIYLIRAYSGGWGKLVDPDEKPFVRTQVPNGSSMDTKALATNIFMVVFDTASAFVAFDQLFPEEMNEIAKAGLEEAFSKILIVMGNLNPTLPDLVSFTGDITKAVLSKLVVVLVEEAHKNFIKFLIRNGEMVAESSVNLATLNTILNLGNPADRLLQLLVSTTPMESSIIVVGNPFAPIPDTQPPSIPTGVTATVVSSVEIALSWTASVDNVGVAGYHISRNGTPLKSLSTTSTSDTGLSPNTTYCYTVSAYDAAGNKSGESPQACASTKPPVYAEWEAVDPPYVSSNWWLSGVYFTSSNEGWAIGTDDSNFKGVLLHYSNGSWISVTPPTVSSGWNLQGLHFTSPTEGWAVGRDWINYKGILLHYSDGLWTSVTPPTVSSNWELFGVHFTSSTEGWAVGEDLSNYKGVLLYYSSGSWTSVTPPTVSSMWTLYGVHLISPTEGWAVGADVAASHGGVLLHYSNGSWTSVTPPTVSSMWTLYGVHLISPTEGWAVGRDYSNDDGVLLHYSDGLWTSVTPPTVSSNWELFGVHFTSSTEGWAVGRDLNLKGALLHYSDGLWTSVTPPTVSSGWELEGLHFTSPTEGWAVGDDWTNYKGVLIRYFSSIGQYTLPVSKSGQDLGQ